jgi:hypothetical protein
MNNGIHNMIIKILNKELKKYDEIYYKKCKK